MEMAQTLVRSVVRAFFSKHDERRIICIIDALVLHSALRDDDLSYLMGINTKDLSKTCGKLEEEHLLRTHHRAELREGKERANARKYYYIDYRQAIDAIKWRTYKLDKAVQGEATGPVEKKEYFCTFCKNEYSQLEVLDSVGVNGFICHRCQHVLKFDPDRQAGGHELSTRLNNQLKFITDVLPRLDTSAIPESTFEAALDAAVPVVRDAANQIAASIAVETVKPTAVQGMEVTGPSSIAINITDTDGIEAEKEAERARKEKAAQMNALPSWHTTSTVSGLSYTGNAAPTAAAHADKEDAKLTDDLTTDHAHDKELAEVFAMMQQSAQLEAAQAEEEEEEEEEEDDEDEFEDVADVTPAPGQKRPASSGPSSGADTPASDRAAKRVKVEEPANDGDSEDEDEVQFEDV